MPEKESANSKGDLGTMIETALKERCVFIESQFYIRLGIIQAEGCAKAKDL